MPFQINATSPPAGGVPVGKGYRLDLPGASGVDGNGMPCGAVGYPSATLTFERMNAAAWEYYSDLVAGEPAVELTSLQVWNPYAATPGWVTFSNTAIMHRPTYGGISEGSYLDVEIKFTKLS